MAGDIHSMLGLKECGHAAIVPDDDVARLMYYINRITRLIDINDYDTLVMSRLTDFLNFSDLDPLDDIPKLLELCIRYCPKELNNKCIYQDDAMCGEYNNMFFAFDTIVSLSTSNGFFKTGNVWVAGKPRILKQMMTYKTKWIDDNWFYPLRSCLHLLKF